MICSFLCQSYWFHGNRLYTQPGTVYLENGIVLMLLRVFTLENGIVMLPPILHQKLCTALYA